MNNVITKKDPLYPPLLHEITDPPAQLFYKGEKLNPADNYFSIVGTRRPSPYGKEMAAEFASKLATSGFVIVSGLAYGIDSIAHEAAVDAGGKTVAVLGSGLQFIAPQWNFDVAEKIMKHGTIITEFPYGTRPSKYNFPQRNRIIAGMSRATLIIDAPLKSGALITARFALEYNRDVFAVPGNITQETSQGANRLLRDNNAFMVTCVQDIFDYLALGASSEKVGASLQNPHLAHLSADEENLYNILRKGPHSIDELQENLTLPIQKITTTLSLLELKGLITIAGSYAFVTR